MTKPKLSIVCITYNHDQYISDAIDSFLSQNYSHPIELIIADDASQDRTQKIIQKYKRKYPKIIKPILRDQNIGIGENLKNSLKCAQGEYIAMCEGDDYWTDNRKLQIQSDYLDRNPKHYICFHRTKVIYENNEREIYYIPNTRNLFSIKMLITSNFMHTSSVVYRKLKYDKLPTNILPIDWYLNLQHAKAGNIGYIDKTMSVYRRNKNSIWYPDPANVESFWLKRGVGHGLMFEAVHDLFKGTKYKKNVENTQNDWTQFLVELDMRHGTELISQLCVLAPNSIHRFIKNKEAQLIKIQSQLNNSNNQLLQIKKTNTWRLRNKLIKVISNN